MPRVKAVKAYNSVVRGLITEATALTFPENASYDEDNCILFTNKGNRRRRLGIDYEFGFTSLVSPVLTEDLDSVVVSTNKWTSVSGNGNLNFSVIQIGSSVLFFDLATQPISNNKKTFEINLENYKVSSVTTASTEKISVASGKGALFIVSKSIEPIVVEYNEDSDSVTVSNINIQIRDFDGLEDGLEVSEQPSTLSTEHRYNLYNQGWDTPSGLGTQSYLVDTYETAVSAYPSNAQIWFVTQNDDNTWGGTEATELSKENFGNTPAAKGHFIVDAFNIDRSDVSGISNIDVESEQSRPTTVSFFSGRVWYSGVESDKINGNIYFSQILNKRLDNAGKCYQDADPTSSEDSDLVQSDGGVIVIPEAGNILKLFPIGSSIIVFADNGIWGVSGVDQSFKATDFFVYKISGVGCLNRDSVVSAEGTPIFFSETGIYTVVPNEVSQQLGIRSLSEETIQTFYENIPKQSRENAVGSYDPSTKRVNWLYSSNTNNYSFYYDKVLILDVQLGSFYPWSISSLDSNTPYVTGIFSSTELITPLESEPVVVGTELVVVGSDVVVASSPSTIGEDSFFTYLVFTPNGVQTNYTFAGFTNSNFRDWKTEDGGTDTSGANYTSFIDVGYEFGGDITNFKQTPYIWVYSQRTETGYQLNTDGGYDLKNPSGCLMRIKWDWSDSPNSKKWSSQKQVYRFRQLYPPSLPDLDFENGFPVTISKQKVRGKGKALQFNFTSEEGKDFDLLGWAAVYSANADG